MLHPALLLGASLLLSGCLSPGEARLPGGTYRLQPAADAPPQESWEEVIVDQPKYHAKYLAHALNTGTKTRLTIVDPTTLATLLTCTYEAGALHRNGLIPAKDVPSELPLALLQIVSWPAPSVRTGLSGRLTLAEDSHERRLSQDGEPVVIIAYSAQQVRTVTLPRYGTTITIRPSNQP